MMMRGVPTSTCRQCASAATRAFARSQTALPDAVSLPISTRVAASPSSSPSLRRSFVTIQRPFTSVPSRQDQQQRFDSSINGTPGSDAAERARSDNDATAAKRAVLNDNASDRATVTQRQQSSTSEASGQSRQFTKAAQPPPKPTRALLYVPGSNLKMLKKALAHVSSSSSSKNGKLAMDVPDALILDLEDSVAAGQKGEARRNVFDVLQSVGETSGRLFVRINTQELGEDDLEVILKASHLDGLVLPKVNCAEDVLKVERAIEEHALDETRDSLRIIASIESPLAIINLKEIATCSKRIEALLFAAEDYCASSNLVRTDTRQEMLFARSSVVTVAKAFGLGAIDLVRTSYKGEGAENGLRDESEEGRRLGFDGKQAIHPAQVATIQRAFTPSEKEIERAAQMLSQYDVASGKGSGAYGLQAEDGSTSMIDAPMLLQAEKILSVARAAGIRISTNNKS
ncbi:hypothetical protein ACM66B_005409 [Microbotryomycetes sp. NB124-2]